MPRALILGINGQDGSYLAELLLEKDYQVTGWLPVAVPLSLENISHLQSQIDLVEGDLTSQASLVETLESARPDEIYNLAAPSFPAASWDSPARVGDVAGLGVMRLLEAIRLVVPNARFYQASSSELFGNPLEVPQRETTPFHPRNPYGLAKLFAHWATVNHRERYGLYAVSGILFNHESPRRPPEFVTRKISLAAARIKLGLDSELRLGNLDACRDWGYAGDYVRAMWLMLQAAPVDYVVGTGRVHSVRRLCELAFGALDLDYQQYVVQDPSLMRAPEQAQLVADPSRAMSELGWQPAVSFEGLIESMVLSDIKALQRE